ncbi:CHAT domain protein [compost metagenome]
MVSEEPYMPWELMVPNGGPAGQGRSLPLGAEFNVGRWIYQTKTPNRALSLHDSRIIAPKYDDDNALPLSQAEAAAVAEAYAGQVITPAKFEEVSMALCSRSSLLHFICHGEDKGSAGQTLLLDDSDSLTATNLFGIDGVEEAFHTKAPVVFLNACEVGRGNPSLIGTRNFASQFIQLGAQAVIAPLWSVDDTVAHEVALSFYSALKAAPTKPLAEILRDIRKKAYETGKDTYAAYCFFGNPFATAV